MRTLLFLLAATLLCIGCSEKSPSTTATVDQTPTGEGQGEWLLHGLSPGEQRFSPLKQIHPENLDKLGLAFEFRDFIVRGRTHRGVESTALMDDGILYFTGPWSVVYALDARTGETRWVYDPQVDGQRARVLCCDAVNRGVALKSDKVFVGTIDGYLIALDKNNGKELWKVDTLVDRNASYSITGAPRLTDKLVVIGNGGAEMGVRGYVTAYEMDTGKQAWRFFTVPSAGPDESDAITKARETWSEDMRWEYGGGGTVWDSMVYDPALNLFFIGTGNGSPWPSWERGGGDNLYLSSIVALDANSGELKWHYQTTPADSWDFTATQHMILADIEWQGASRKVIMQAPKNGFFYVLDRATGELLSAEPFTTVNWATHVDLKTGRPQLSPAGDYSQNKKLVRPTPGGAHNWHPMAFNPNTGLVYIPSSDLALIYDRKNDGLGYKPFTLNVAGTARPPNPVLDGELLAEAQSKGEELKFESRIIGWDPVAGKARWRSEPLAPSPGGLLSTAANLLIGGTTTGYLNFYQADSGELLHRIHIGTDIMAPPMTYELDGQQYLAVLAGKGGAGHIFHSPVSAANQYQNFERLLVFKLGGTEVPLPQAIEPPHIHPIPSGLPQDAETIALGQTSFNRYCAYCHARNGQPGGYPNLWNMDQLTHENFDQIVLDGAFVYAGMANFSDVIGPKETLAIRAFIADTRKKLEAQQGAENNE